MESKSLIELFFQDLVIHDGNNVAYKGKENHISLKAGKLFCV